MSEQTAQRGGFPYKAFALVLSCVVLAFGAAVAAGFLQVRRPAKLILTRPEDAPTPEQPPKSYVHRAKSAEHLSGAQWVYRFAGGLPKCWVEIESEGNKQTLGPWVSVTEPVFFGADPLDRPIPESVEGYIALFRPAAKEQTYRLAYAVTKVKYPDNPKREGTITGFRQSLQVKLPDLLPAPKPKGEGPIGVGVGTREDGEDPQPLKVGEDSQLNFLLTDTAATEHGLHIRLKFRFLTPEEAAAAAGK